MSYIAIIDFETTGLDIEKDSPTEFAAVVYDTERKLYVKTFESFFKYPDASELTKVHVCQNISKIYAAYPAVFPSVSGFLELHGHLESGLITHLVAYNANFDRAFFNKACAQLGLTIPTTPWVCAKNAVPYHLLGIKPGRLVHTAAELGLLNPFPHRAISDCLTTMLVLQKFEWPDILAYWKQPNTRIIADVSFEHKDLAKEAGFRWHPINRYWYLDVRDIPASFPFKTYIESER